MDQDLFIMAMECTNAYSDCDTSFTKGGFKIQVQQGKVDLPSKS